MVRRGPEPVALQVFGDVLRGANLLVPLLGVAVPSDVAALVARGRHPLVPRIGDDFSAFDRHPVAGTVGQHGESLDDATDRPIASEHLIPGAQCAHRRPAVRAGDECVERQRLPLDHGVSGVGASRRDEGDAWGPLGDPVRPSGASGRLPGTTPPGDEPCEPVVAARGVLVGASVREVPLPVRLAVAGHLVAVERLPRLVGQSLQAEQGSFLGGRRPPAPLLVFTHGSRVLP